MTWDVYLTCGHEVTVNAGPTPPYERGDGIVCPLDGVMHVQGITAVV